VTGSSFRFNF